MLIFGVTVGGNKMAIKGFIDKLTGKARREEEERLAAEHKTRLAEERRAKKAAKKSEEAAKKNDPKARATAAGEPWVAVLGIDVNKDDPDMGAFELDWNDIFVARLIKAGYQGKTDQDIVDNWFQAVCRNVVLETYEQEQADPEKRAAGSNRRDLGNGRTEVS
jgi:hypothetical protein